MDWDPIIGESPLTNAPKVHLESGAQCIPQHYLSYRHTLASVQQIILDCDFDDDYIIMAGEDGFGLFVQIGIVGYDTFKPIHSQTKKKIVYGRRWRIEPEFPTSELIQTIFLAIKKAREHEIRERFKIQVNNKKSAPFSTHQDLPLIVAQAEFMSYQQPAQTFTQFRRALVNLLQGVSFDHAKIAVMNIEQRYNNEILLDFRLLLSEHSELPENKKSEFSLLLPEPDLNFLLYLLMEHFIARSDSYVNERFCYRKVARFSRNLSISKIAQLSVHTRQKLSEAISEGFYTTLKEYNDCIDQKRAPKILTEELANTIKSRLTLFGPLEGYEPE
ncbi:hypothetical protein [Glaciecola sp. 1036]|uniref:hypothetical protein n=1 Tax=Alteromonadaceae TaxID=72275 RepID=UPI003D070138